MNPKNGDTRIMAEWLADVVRDECGDFVEGVYEQGGPYANIAEAEAVARARDIWGFNWYVVVQTYDHPLWEETDRLTFDESGKVAA